MTARILDGKAIAAELRERLAEEVREFVQSTGITPQLGTILVGDDPASAVYIRNKNQSCMKAGMLSRHEHLAVTATQAELLDLIARWNADPAIHGILVQLPLPPQIDETVILDAVAPWKDVDCFHPENVGRLSQGRPRFLPCTPHGVQVLLMRTGVPIDGAHAVIIGRSEIVGKPLAMMLVQKGVGANATVTLCHSRTKDLPAICRSADLLIAAIGKPEFVTADMVKPGAVVIDVGINRVGNKLVGDVKYEEVRAQASFITPVPGGVGPMTIAMLLRNTLTAARVQAAVTA